MKYLCGLSNHLKSKDKITINDSPKQTQLKKIYIFTTCITDYLIHNKCSRYWKLMVICWWLVIIIVITNDYTRLIVPYVIYFYSKASINIGEWMTGFLRSCTCMIPFPPPPITWPPIYLPVPRLSILNCVNLLRTTRAQSLIPWEE